MIWNLRKFWETIKSNFDVENWILQKFHTPDDFEFYSFKSLFKHVKEKLVVWWSAILPVTPQQSKFIPVEATFYL